MYQVYTLGPRVSGEYLPLEAIRCLPDVTYQPHHIRVLHHAQTQNPLHSPITSLNIISTTPSIMIITSTNLTTTSLISPMHYLNPLPIVLRRVWGSSYQLHSPSSLNSTLSPYPLTNLSESFYSLTEFNLPILLPIRTDTTLTNYITTNQPSSLVFPTNIQYWATTNMMITIK